MVYAGAGTYTEGSKVRDYHLSGAGAFQEYVRHYLHAAEVKADQAGISWDGRRAVGAMQNGRAKLRKIALMELGCPNAENRKNPA